MTTIQDDVRKELGEDVIVSDCDGYWMFSIATDSRCVFEDTIKEAISSWRELTEKRSQR